MAEKDLAVEQVKASRVDDIEQLLREAREKLEAAQEAKATAEKEQAKPEEPALQAEGRLAVAEGRLKSAEELGTRPHPGKEAAERLVTEKAPLITRMEKTAEEQAAKLNPAASDLEVARGVRDERRAAFLAGPDRGSRRLADGRVEPHNAAEMARHFTLSTEDLILIRTKRRAANRLGFAVQLFLRSAILAASSIPRNCHLSRCLPFLGQQIGVDPTLYEDYARRAETRREHVIELQKPGMTPVTPDCRTLETLGRAVPARTGVWRY